MAVAQRYEELHPGARIHWEKRTLDEFGHKPIDQLCREYDLIIIDHPWADFCFRKGIVYDLKQKLPKENFDDLRKNTVGRSFESYLFNGQLLAAPIDAATPVPSWRPDLIEKSGLEIPGDWDELVAFADKGYAVMPGFDADLFLNWVMLLTALGGQPFNAGDVICDRSTAIEAASLIKRLAEPMPDEIIKWNPIAIAELMTQTDNFLYCPFAYSYNNYSRPSFVAKPLQYGNLINLKGKRLRSVLGGTGMAISSFTKEPETAMDFLLYCSGAFIQSNIYTYSGGQPARVEAWKDEKLQTFTHHFFDGSFDSHRDALIRPRYDGFVDLQKTGGMIMQQFILGELSDADMWRRMEMAYQTSRK